MSEAFPPLGPEYDKFLYTIVGNETNGMQLTMASAIARSGADPWKEAARISKLPEDAALRVLTRLMPDLPSAERKPADGQITADRLFSLLPKHKHVLAITKANGVRTEVVTVALVLALCASVMLAYLFTTAPRPAAEDRGGAPVASTTTGFVR